MLLSWDIKVRHASLTRHSHKKTHRRHRSRDETSSQTLSTKLEQNSNQDDFQAIKTTLADTIYQNLRCRESLNSSGTVSRKTSTASEYTPEHTYVTNSNTRGGQGLLKQTSVSYSNDSCLVAPQEIPSVTSNQNVYPGPDVPHELKEDVLDHTDAFKTELADSLKHKDTPSLVPGQKVNLKVFVMSVGSDEQNTTQNGISLSEEGGVTVPQQVTEGNREGSEPVERILTVNVEGSDKKDLLGKSNLLSPQRKISRFLVSPVLSGQLNLPKGKEADVESKSQEPTAGETSSGIVHSLPEKQENLRSQNHVSPSMVEQPVSQQLPTASTQPNISQQQINAHSAAFNATATSQGPTVNSQVPTNVQVPAGASTVLTHPGQQNSQVDISASLASVSTIPSRKTSAPLESTRLEVEKPLEQKISVCSLKEESTKTETGQVCGPELINTIEQLKISLDNLKNSSHPKKEEEAKKVPSNVEVQIPKQGPLAQTQPGYIPPPQTPAATQQQPQFIPPTTATAVTQPPQSMTQAPALSQPIQTMQAPAAQMSAQQVINQPQPIPLSQTPPVVHQPNQGAPVLQPNQVSMPNAGQVLNHSQQPQQQYVASTQNVTQPQYSQPTPQQVTAHQPSGVQYSQHAVQPVSNQQMAQNAPHQHLNNPPPGHLVAAACEQVASIPVQPSSVPGQQSFVPIAGLNGQYVQGGHQQILPNMPQPTTPAVTQLNYQSAGQQPMAAAQPQQQSLTSPQQHLMNHPVPGNQSNEVVYQQQQIYAQPQPMSASGSVQNLATAGQLAQQPAVQGGGHFQQSMSIDENLQGYAKKVLPDLKHVIENGSNRSSQASTPQQEMVYDGTFQRNLQQTLSNINPTVGQYVANTTAPSSPHALVSSLEFSQDGSSALPNISKLSVESSSAPVSGVNSSELLSPVLEADQHSSNNYANQPAAVDPKIKDLNDLNDHLKRINEKQQETQSPMKSLENKTVEAIDEAKRELKLELEKLHDAGTTVNQTLQDSSPDTMGPLHSRERRISRFKVSVVNEPDRSKLTPPITAECKPNFPESVKRESESSTGGDQSSIAAPNSAIINADPMTAQTSGVPTMGTSQTAPTQMVQTQSSGSLRGGVYQGAMGVAGPPGHDFTTVINTTFDSLKTTLVKSLPNTGEQLATTEEEISQLREETFEEMLNRQKAELNALMEAHRRQQLEYMGKYKRQKDRGDT